MSEIAYGRWSANVRGRKKRWLYLPPTVAHALGKCVLLFKGRDGCIQLYPKEKVLPKKQRTETYSEWICGRVQKRITIPPQLLGSISFACGDEVTMVGKQTHFEVWPGRVGETNVR